MPETLDFQGVSVTRLTAGLQPAPTNGNTMTDTKMRTLPTEDWNSSLSHVIADMKGIPFNVHTLLANNPPLLLQSVDELAANSALGPELLEKLDAHNSSLAIIRC